MIVNNTLTPKQKEVLDYIIKFREGKGYSPTVKEMANRFNKSTTTIYQFIKALTEKGFLKKQEKTARGISPKIEEREIFLLGEIAAGKPIEPIENPEPISIPASMFTSSGNIYALKVRGDSMIEEGILDGDIIVVKHQPMAENGDAVVAITEDGATLKIFRRKNGKIVLEPRNKKLKNFSPKKLEIRGKFVGLVRKQI